MNDVQPVAWSDVVGVMVLRYGRERLDEALELMLEVILSKRPYIRIAGDDFPREIVKSRFHGKYQVHL